MRRWPRPTWNAPRGKLSLFLLLIPLFSALLVEEPFVLLLGASAVLWHEGGHLFFFLLCGVPPSRLFADTFGLRLESALPLSPKKEALIAIGGPLFNLLAAALLLLFGHGDFFRLYATLHLMPALFNLLPVFTTDGGRLLLLLLHALLPTETAEAAFRLFSAILLAFLFFFCAFLFYFGGIGLYGVFFSLFFFWRVVCDDFNKKRDLKSF